MAKQFTDESLYTSCAVGSTEHEDTIAAVVRQSLVSKL